MEGQNDGDRLLPGEETSVSSGNLEDVRHWVAVYAELVDFKDTLLQELDDHRGRVTPEGRVELDNDEQMLRRETARLKRRLDFWRGELAKHR
jgi:hypothetical protein